MNFSLDDNFKNCKEFLDAIFLFTKQQKHVSFNFSEKNGNSLYIYRFFNLLIEKSNNKSYYDEHFNAFSFYVNIDDDFYIAELNISKISFLSLTYFLNPEEIVTDDCIKICLNSDIIEDRELIEYIVVNKDSVKEYNITTEKIAVHTAHAATIFACENYENPLFKEWYGDGTIQKKVILQAHEKEIRKLKYYGVEDVGYNQVPKGTLIAVSLGIMTKKELKSAPIIKRFQIFNYNNILS